MFGLTPYSRRGNDIARRLGFFDLGKFFDEFFNEPLVPAFVPAVQPIRADIRETDTEYIIDAEIPGVRKEDIKLELRDDTLTISVEHNEELNEERENYIRRERRYGSFSRSFYVENVKNDQVTAKYNNGVLTIILPKEKEGRRKSYKIDIQ